MTTFNLSRRAMLGVASAMLVPAAASAATPKRQYDEMTDVLVVGSGFAGMAAALAAAQSSAKVIVIEKMAFLGGNSSISGGMLAVPGSSVQKEQGIEDSPEKLMADMTRIGQGLGDPELIRFVCEKASETFEWTRTAMGVEWNTHLTGKGGHSAPRCMVTKQGTGQGILGPCSEKLKALGVPLRTRVYMEKIFREDDGRVTGVQVREGWRMGKPDSGKVKTIGVTRGIVLAFGGFGADVKYRKRLDPKLGEAFLTTNQPGATAEGLRMASRIGANVIQADWIQCLPSCSPAEKGMGLASHFATIAGSLFGVWVDSQTSRRFVDEFGNRKVCTDAILGVINRGGKALALSDQNGVDEFEVVRPGLTDKILKSGALRQFATLKDLADAYQLDPKVLEATFARYNELLAAGKDADFGRRFDKRAKPLAKAPFYVSEMSPKVHHCMGGVATNVTTAVLDVETDEPIPGLFAAGECVGGIHGAVRIGACAVMDCLVNGRQAGLSAAKSRV